MLNPNRKTGPISRIFALMFSFTAIFFFPTLNQMMSGQPMSMGGERQERISNWDGIWVTNCGRMELAQDGMKIIGTYGPNNGRISGNIKGNILVFNWTEEPGGQFANGVGEFTLSFDEDDFVGWWAYGGEKNNYDWTGYRAGDREIDVLMPDVDYCLWRGSFNTTDGVVNFFQELDDPTVTGELARLGSTATFEGVADGWELRFDWETESGESGSGIFEMATHLGSFTSFFDNEGILGTTDWDGIFSTGESDEVIKREKR